jgi:hypothetical protein
LEEILRMRNRIVKVTLIAVLVVASCFIMVEATNPKKDVWWEKVDPGSPTEGMWKAYILKMNNGVVHEWRYEFNGDPVKVHLIYQPVALFPDKPSDKWICWTYDLRYNDLPGDEGDLKDYFTLYDSYWVSIHGSIL